MAKTIAKLVVKGVIQESNFECAFGLMYGPHERSIKTRMWDELKEASVNLVVPYLFMGDFNEVLRVEDRKSCFVVPRCMEDFASWVDELNLIDLPLGGQKYTWERGRSRSRIVRILIQPQ